MPQEKPLLAREYVSYSELKIWNECSYRHKLAYIEQKDHFTSNEFTTFGTAVHTACEKIVLDENLNASKIFNISFNKGIESLEIKNPDLIEQMKLQAETIMPKVLPALLGKFEDYSVVAVEEELFEDIEFENNKYQKKFKGYIDLVLKTSDGKYHIIDWKTCSWGWDARKKSDKMMAYQLVLYKNFYSQKHGIPMENIETHFALLKRTAKKDNVEFVPVSSGPTRVKNALGFVEKAMKNIDKGFSIKNRLSCKYCPFYNTKDCP